jgi:hypothetical protein
MVTPRQQKGSKRVDAAPHRTRHEDQLTGTRAYIAAPDDKA